MEVYHEKFGTGKILKSTEQFDEAGNIISADVMFEHGIEQDIQLEEIEDLDELSKKTLGSYVKKAANDSSARTGYAGELHQKALDLNDPRDNRASQKRILSDRDKELRVAYKRKRGINKAVNKLTKEEIEDLENDILDIVVEAVNSALKEAAKWRNSSAVGSISSPEYNYDNMDVIHPKSTGVKKAKSDTPTAYSSLMSRPKPQFAKTGDRKGMVTKQHIDRLKSRIKAGQMEDFENDILDIVDEAVNSALNEKLIGNQKKIDANKNGKIDGEDFKKLRKEEVSESVVVTPRMTPDSASMRMPAVESVVRDIMSQQRNLRQEAKVAEFKSRNK